MWAYHHNEIIKKNTKSCYFAISANTLTPKLAIANPNKLATLTRVNFCDVPTLFTLPDYKSPSGKKLPPKCVYYGRQPSSKRTF